MAQSSQDPGKLAEAVAAACLLQSQRSRPVAPPYKHLLRSVNIAMQEQAAAKAKQVKSALNSRNGQMRSFLKTQKARCSPFRASIICT